MLSKSPLREYSPGTRLGILILLMTACFIASPYWGLSLIYLYILILYKRGKYPYKNIGKKIGSLWLLIIIMGLFQTLFIIEGDSSTLWWQGRFFAFSLRDITLFWVFVFRFLNIISLFHLFSEILSTNEIGHGVEEMLRPFEKMGISTHLAALFFTLLFRFVPILRQEIERIDLVQRARGAQFMVKKQGFIKKVLSRLPLMIPLFITALERSEFLVEAMEARCFEAGKERSRFIMYNKGKRDLLWILEILFIISIIIFIKTIHLDEKTGVFIYENIKRFS